MLTITQRENEKMKTVIKDHESIKKDLEEKLIKLSEQPVVVHQAPQAVQSTKVNLLQDEAERLIAELDRAKDDLNKSQHDHQNLMNEVEDYMEQNELMGHDLESQFHKIKQLETNCDELEEQNNELAQLNDNLQNQNEFNHDMVQRARQRIRQLCEAAKKSEKMSKSEPNLVSIGNEPTSDRNDKLKSSDTLDSGIFDDVIGDVMDLTQHHDELTQKMRHYEALLQENDQLKAEYAQLLNQNGRLKKANNQLQSQLDDIDKAFEESSIEDVHRTSNPVAKVVLLKKVNDELNQSLNQSRLDDEESNSKITELLQSENDRLIEENEGLKEALETSMRIDDYKSQPESLEKRLSDLEVVNNELVEENGQLIEEIDTLNQKLKQEPYEETVDNQKGLKRKRST